MIIEKITIKSFGQLSNLTMDFSETVNVIEGANEAGKSTIAAFIKYMLYGFEPDGAGIPKDAVTERRKRISWDTGIAEGSMQVLVGGKRYLINRSTIAIDTEGAPSYREDSSIVDLENGSHAFGKNPAGKVFLGVERELFENTAFIGLLGDTAIESSPVLSSIEAILFSERSRQDTAAAAAVIKEKMEMLLRGENTGGLIIDLMKKQEDLEASFRNTDEDNKQILAKEAELHEIRSRIAEAETKRDKFLDLDQCYKNVILIQTFDKLHELEEEALKKTEDYNNFIKESTVKDFVPSSEYLTDIALARRSIQDTAERLTEAQAKYAKEKSAVGITKEIEAAIELSDEKGGEAALTAKQSSISKAGTASLGGGAFASLVALAGGITALILSQPVAKIALGILALVALIGGGACALLYLRSRKSMKAMAAEFGTENAQELKAKLSLIAEARLKRDTMLDNIENARLELEKAKMDCDSARSNLAKTYMRWNEQAPKNDINEALDQLEARVKQFLSRKLELKDIKNTLDITVREMRRNLSDKNEIDIRAQVPPLKRKSLAKENYEDIVSGISDAKVIIEEQQRLAFQVENELQALKRRASDPGELYSKIQALDTKIDDLGMRHKAYYVALCALENASDSLRGEIAPRLGEYAAQLMAIMTNEKYDSLSVGDGLTAKFKSADGVTRSVDYLSCGTRDLAYVALRMALIYMLYSEKPPVCFDETFAGQDNIRAESMMKAISRQAKEGYQSFIFTCRARESTLAQENIEGAAIFRLS